MSKESMLGRIGEEKAIEYLCKLGYAILEHNYKRRCGEIDIIARDGDTMVFCEVKTRRSERFALAREAVDRNKQKRLIQTAMVYLQEKNWHGPCRFDVAEVYVKVDGEWKMQHLIDAFGV